MNRDQLWNPTLGNRVWATLTFFVACEGADKPASITGTEKNSKSFTTTTVFTVMSCLLAISVFAVIGLTVGIFHIKRKLSRTKGNGFNRCIVR